MAARRSRTYRMRLSREGTRLFLSCHCRLAQLTGLFIPYGTTLFVAVLLAEAGDPSDLAAELTDRRIMRLSGDIEHYVGTSTSLSGIVDMVGERIAQSDVVSARPSIAHIHLASLLIMAGCEDDALTRAYGRMADLTTTT